MKELISKYFRILEVSEMIGEYLVDALAFNNTETRNDVIAFFNAGLGDIIERVICDETNNTPELIDGSNLVADLYYQENGTHKVLNIIFGGVSTHRKFKIYWTPEMAQDLQAFHNIDAEAELTALLSEQLSSEIDRELVLGIKGSTILEAGYVYAPYVPLMETPEIIGGFDLANEISTRYSKKMVDERYYKSINFTDY